MLARSLSILIDQIAPDVTAALEIGIRSISYQTTKHGNESRSTGIDKIERNAIDQLAGVSKKL
jgi:hypothetical protein